MTLTEALAAAPVQRYGERRAYWRDADGAWWQGYLHTSGAVRTYVARARDHVGMPIFAPAQEPPGADWQPMTGRAPWLREARRRGAVANPYVKGLVHAMLGTAIVALLPKLTGTEPLVWATGVILDAICTLIYVGVRAREG